MILAHHMMTFEGYAQNSNLPFDLETSFRALKAIGYDGVELGGDEKTLGKPAHVNKLLQDIGLECVAFSTAVTANPYPPNTEQYRREMDFAAGLGVKIIAVCGGWLPEPRRSTFDDDYKLFAENLSEARQYSKQYDQVFTYHPHCGCMVETNEEVQRLWKFIPDLDLCVDTGHLAAVRSDPAWLVKAFPERIKHIHLKDWSRARRKFMEVGFGDVDLDFRGFFAALKNIGYDGPIAVERDDPPLPAEESARMSREYLRTIGV